MDNLTKLRKLATINPCLIEIGVKGMSIGDFLEPSELEEIKNVAYQIICDIRVGLMTGERPTHKTEQPKPEEEKKDVKLACESENGKLHPRRCDVEHMPRAKAYRKKIKDFDAVSLQEMLDKKWSVKKIAEYLNMSEKAVNYWISKWNLNTGKSKLERALVDDISREAKKHGMSYGLFVVSPEYKAWMRMRENKCTK